MDSNKSNEKERKKIAAETLASYTYFNNKNQTEKVTRKLDRREQKKIFGLVKKIIENVW